MINKCPGCGAYKLQKKILSCTIECGYCGSQYPDDRRLPLTQGIRVGNISNSRGISIGGNVTVGRDIVAGDQIVQIVEGPCKGVTQIINRR